MTVMRPTGKQITLLLLCFYVFGCAVSPPLDIDSDQPAQRATTSKTSPSVEVDDFAVSIKIMDGRCAVSYRRPDAPDAAARTLPTRIAPPCEFIQQGPHSTTPLFYSYGRGKKRVTVLMVTGGFPDASLKDPLQPDGCGTELQKVLVFGDRVEVREDEHYENNNVPPSERFGFCPTHGLDEVWFGA